MQAANHEEEQEEAEGDVGQVHGLELEVGRAEGPEAGPEADDAADRGDSEESWMMVYEVEGEIALLGHVGDLAKLLIPGHLDWVAGGVDPGRVGCGGIAVVAGVELEPEAIAHEEAGVHDALIAGPSRECRRG